MCHSSEYTFYLLVVRARVYIFPKSPQVHARYIFCKNLPNSPYKGIGFVKSKVGFHDNSSISVHVFYIRNSVAKGRVSDLGNLFGCFLKY